MGFFNTQPKEDGSAQFTVSEKWWWYIAVSIPVTLALFGYMMLHSYYARSRIETVVKGKERRASEGYEDLELQVVNAAKKEK